jgi:hypothetical protein
MKLNNICLAFTSILFVVLLSSCSQSNKLASSFGKRKYTKGYFVERPSPHPEIFTANIASSLPSHVIPIQIKLNRISISTPSKESPLVIKANRESSKQENNILRTVIASDSVNQSQIGVWGKHDKEINYLAIAGCAVSVAGAIIAAAAGSFTPLAIAVVIIAVVLCIISLFLHRIYYNWLGALGLFILITMFTLIVL